MYPSQAEQCNHDFLIGITAWPDSEQRQPTHYCKRPEGTVILLRVSDGVRWWFDGHEWCLSLLGAGPAHKLHCTRAMWLTAQHGAGQL